MNESGKTNTGVLDPLTDEIQHLLANILSPIPEEVPIGIRREKKKPKHSKATGIAEDSKWHFVARNQTRNCPNCVLYSAKTKACGVLSVSCTNNPDRPRFLSKIVKGQARPEEIGR